MEASTKKVQTTLAPTPAEILTSIATWTKSRSNAAQLISYVEQGNCFSIQRSEFTKWNERTPEFLHAYPAVYNGKMVFVLVDNVTDCNADLDFDYVFMERYTNGAVTASSTNLPTNNDITVQEGLERTFRWQMTKSTWIATQVLSRNGMFQAFKIPYSDLTALFAGTTGNVIFGMIGLRSNNTADIILWNNVTQFSPSMLADMSVPVPPFSAENPESNYQLLVQS